MKGLFIPIFILLFCSTTFDTFGQNTVFTKHLLDSTTLIQNSRTVILKETDTFVVLTTYPFFIDNCEQFIKEHNLDEDKELLKLFTTNMSKNIYADSITKSKIYKSRLIFRIADLLENGQCLVYNKQKKLLEKLIIKETYSTSYVTGRMIKTEGKHLILETIDGVF